MTILHFFQKFVVLIVTGLVLAPGIISVPTVNAMACNKRPAKPEIATPGSSAYLHTRRVELGWKSADCATHYQVEVRQGKTWGRPWDANYGLTETSYRTRKLEAGQTYWWHVEACNSHGCKSSRWISFVITP